ncbi:MAG: LLM class F420-dependent oxidoreductase [Acidimicrobiia bacterium]|nr:LLM class F420-dependent oxidoreductase [Acidimicrobiia bacterium]MDH3397328.1 LLM class F420-dependent oxidoreductase [Acidimicrobiia bacterium]
MEMGRVGLWSGQLGVMRAVEVREAVPEIESLGFRVLWFPESVTKEAFSQAAILLAASREMGVATGIANLWARDATAMANGARTLAEAFPDRFLLGIGVSHSPSVSRRGHDYRHPLSAMRAYLDAMDGAPYAGPQPEKAAPVLLAALGPKMLRLAAQRSAGAHPYFVPVDHTRFARNELGPDPILAPEQAVVLADNAGEARTIARRHARHYLGLDNYRNNLLRLGWSNADVAGDGSDGLIDAVVAWGSPDVIQERVAAHFAAGANHVCVQVLDGLPDRFPLDELRRLAPALLEL